MNKIRQAYRGLMILITANYNSMGRHLPYTVISWGVCILMTLLMPIVLPIVIFKILLGIITNKDADDALKENSRVMAVYQETSEFEYRSAAEVFMRILKNIPRHKAPDGFMVLDSDPVPQEYIVADFVGYEGKLYKIRPETKDEYVTRRTREELSVPAQGNEAELEKTFAKHFDIIEKKSGGNIVKSYYLGLDILAKKIRIGNSKARPPAQPTHEVLQN